MENKKRLIDGSPDDCIKKTKRKTNFARIIVSGTVEKPYYEIMWFNYLDGQYHIGYGSYNLNFVFQWLAECFEVEDALTVDAVEVVHGWWMPQYDRCWIDGQRWKTGYHCSSCMGFNKVESHYCPNCGAKMRGDKE